MKKIEIDGWELINEMRAFTPEEQWRVESVTTKPTSWIWFAKKSKIPHIHDFTEAKELIKDIEILMRVFKPKISEWDKQHSHPSYGTLRFLVTHEDSNIVGFYCKRRSIVNKIIKKIKKKTRARC